MPSISVHLMPDSRLIMDVETEWKIQARWCLYRRIKSFVVQEKKGHRSSNAVLLTLFQLREASFKADMSAQELRSQSAPDRFFTALPWEKIGKKIPSLFHRY